MPLIVAPAPAAGMVRADQLQDAGTLIVKAGIAAGSEDLANPEVSTARSSAAFAQKHRERGRSRLGDRQPWLHSPAIPIQLYSPGLGNIHQRPATGLWNGDAKYL